MTLSSLRKGAALAAAAFFSCALVAQNDISFIITTDCWGGEVS